MSIAKIFYEPGTKIKNYTVIKRTGKVIEKPNKAHGKIYKSRFFEYKCLCDCGKTFTILDKYMKPNQKVSSCGCARITNLIGRNIGYLTVIKLAGHTTHGKNPVRSMPLWECLCKCGGTCHVKSSNLLSGDTKSCGCVNKKEWISRPCIGCTISQYYKSFVRNTRDRGIKINYYVDEQALIDLYKKQNYRCALSGLPITFMPQRTASLDRIDSSKHYTLDNIQFVHHCINIMKNNLVEEEFIQLCTAIALNKNPNLLISEPLDQPQNP